MSITLLCFSSPAWFFDMAWTSVNCRGRRNASPCWDSFPSNRAASEVFELEVSSNLFSESLDWIRAFNVFELFGFVGRC